MRRIVSLLAGAITVVGGLVFTSAGTASADPSANAWYQLRMCESSNRYDINTGNGYYGAYQFDLPTWRSVGGSGYPNQASKAEQDYRALILYRMRGWSPWVCAALVGLQPDSDAASGVMPPRPGSSASGGGSASGSTGGSQSGSDTGSSTPAWPGRQYHEGDYSAKLKVWQQQAGKLGYGLVGTGYFGPHTEKAVRAIQRKAGLNVVGFIGPKTWAAAWDTDNAKNTNNGSTSSAPKWPGRQFFEGDYSAKLKVWQKQAGKLGYGLVGTGYFGPHTEKAVRAIQRKAGLNVVGFIGPKTWAAAWDTSNAKNANNSTGSGSGSTVTYVPQTDKSCHVGAAKAPTWPGKQFRFGQTARELQCFQKELGHRGYDLLGTGYYGSVTKSVVLDLQRRNGIPDSGIVGPKTWKAAWEGKVR